MYRTVKMCKGETLTGQPCKTAVYRDELCFVHYQKLNGNKLPQHNRQKTNRTTTDKMLTRFGMPAKEVQKLGESYPELRTMLAKETDLVEMLETLSRVMAVRVVANPHPDIAKSLVILSDFLSKLDKKKTTKAKSLDLFGE